MTEASVLGNPSAALEATFTRVHRQQMQGMPVCNPALTVEAVGFRPWGPHWLGVLITPWFMSLWLMPRLLAQWQALPAREVQRHPFPAGVFAFIAGHAQQLGSYQACSLFSPMFEFVDAASARATALAALDALLQDNSRREFLSGSTGRTAQAPHGP
jgi:[NiFe] hydrogenase assembly HybE family chaperone